MRVGLNSYSVYNDPSRLIAVNQKSRQKNQDQNKNSDLTFGISKTPLPLQLILVIFVFIAGIIGGPLIARMANKSSAENDMMQIESRVSPQEFENCKAKIKAKLEGAKDPLNMELSAICSEELEKIKRRVGGAVKEIPSRVEKEGLGAYLPKKH